MPWRSEFKYEKKKKKIIRKQLRRHQNQQGHFGRCGGSQQHPCTDLPGFTVGGAALKRAAALESAPRTAPAAAAAAAAAKSLQSYPTLCDPIDGSPPGSPIPGILQARTLEWVAISFFNAWKWKWSRVWLLATPWIASHQALPSMGFSRQEYWSGVPLPSQSYA